MKIIQLLFTTIFISILQTSFAQNEVYVPFNKKMHFESKYYSSPQVRYLWGFSDTTCAIVLPCEYERVGYYKNGFFTVYKKGAWGVVNKKNEVVIDFQYKSIQIEKGLFIVEKGKESAVVDLNNDIVLDFEEQEITIHHQYIETKPFRKHKTIHDRSGVKLVPEDAYLSTVFEYGPDTYFIYGFYAVNALAKITTNGNSPVEVLIDTSQNRQIKITEDQKYFQIYRSINFKSNNSKTKAFLYLYSVKEILESKSIAKAIEKDGKNIVDFPEYHDDGKPNILFGQNNETSRELRQKISDYKSSPYWKLSSLKIDTSYQLIFQKIRWNDGSGKRTLQQDTLPTKYKDISFISLGNPRTFSNRCLKFCETYDTLQANLAIATNEKGFTGILDTKLKSVIPFEYEEIKPYFYSLDFREPIFICKKEGKWGFINLANQSVIKFAYDEIKKLEKDYYSKSFEFSKGIAAKKNGKYGIIDLMENELTPFIFDEVFYNENIKSYSLEKEGKYGLFADGIYIPPVYDYRINEIVSINEYEVFRTTSGYYIDPKGTVYFDH